MNFVALKQSAERLDALLREYSGLNEDARSALRQCQPIIESIRLGEIHSPNQVLFPYYYFSTESSLFEHRDVCEEAALLAMYLEGWNSEEEYNAHMEKVLKRADAEEQQLRKNRP